MQACFSSIVQFFLVLIFISMLLLVTQMVPVFLGQKFYFFSFIDDVCEINGADVKFGIWFAESTMFLDSRTKTVECAAESTGLHSI